VEEEGLEESWVLVDWLGRKESAAPSLAVWVSVGPCQVVRREGEELAGRSFGGVRGGRGEAKFVFFGYCKGLWFWSPFSLT
jgi:hypothetical protein